MPDAAISRDDLAERYLEQLPYTPYRVQEDALLAWFSAPQGVLVCAPTGTGKTLIAEAALFEALHTGRVAYYTTPLIALTEQKFVEMQRAAVQWGFSADDVGLVTGNRRVNPRARVLVVVAEILLNRLLNPAQFDFTEVAAVVMDEFHNFGDPQRGIVWELALSLLPPHVRLLLLSATVGNAAEFVAWLDRAHGRKVELVEGTERRVPLSFHWVADELLTDHITQMAQGDERVRRTPALVFCFNREECWSIAEQLKGCPLVFEPARSQLLAEVNQCDFTGGAGPKLKQLLMRGVGVHHAGMLPRYRRLVEELFQRKLLAVALCTETLAAGINLPARSVVMTSLVKGAPGKRKLLDPSIAHQIFGRAGRPQFDTEGFVYALAHEDDVRILRWKQKYDAIPEDTKDPGLLKAKKALKKKRPTRRENETYWDQAQFDKLRAAPPARLYSKGPLPWRLLAYLLDHSPEVDRIRRVVRKRLMDEPRLKAADAALDQMLVTLHHAGFVKLVPDPPPPGQALVEAPPAEAPEPPRGTLAALLSKLESQTSGKSAPAPAPPPRYQAELARPTAELPKLLVFRSVNPLYGAFLMEQLGIADPAEQLQALESVLGMPSSVLRQVRVPFDMPPGPLATTRLDAELIQRGLMAAPPAPDDEDEPGGWFDEPRDRPLLLADKLRMLFDHQYPGVTDVETLPVWVVGEVLEFGGKFDNYVKARDLVKQEGLVFRHLLRFILLCEEFAQVCPAGMEPADWQEQLRFWSEKATAACRDVDPASTDEAIQRAHAADVVEGESAASVAG